MRIRGWALVVTTAAVAVAAACDASTGPGSQPVRVTVTADTISAGLHAAGDVTWVQFTLPVAIHNGRGVAMGIDYCLASLEAPSVADWTIVWAPVCFLENIKADSIAPGETKTIEWPIAAAVSGPGGPKWGSATVGGTYRFSLGTQGLGTLKSNTFTVNLLPTATAGTPHSD